MKLGINQLKYFLHTELSDDELIASLTKIGLEVEDVKDNAAILAPFVVARVVSCVKHPESSKLNLCKVDDGSGALLQVVCGAANVREGLNVVFARIGTFIPRDNFVIKKANIRGVESCGMICSASELCLGGDADGIIELDESHKVGDKYINYLNIEPKIIDITITPNRGDCASVYGVAKALVSYGYASLKPISYQELGDNIINTDLTKLPKINLDIQTSACKAINLVKIKGVQNCKSPSWLADALGVVGFASKNFLIDMSNYLMMFYGQPCHVFDAAKMPQNILLTEVKEGQELSFKPIAGKTDGDVLLKAGCLVLKDANSQNILALSGIMGGADCAVSEQTSDIIIESAFFNGESITLSSRLSGLGSDSCYRFERGIDPVFTKQCALLLASYITKYCGGVIEAACVFEDVDLQNAKLIEVSPDYLSTKLGLQLDTADIITRLQLLGMQPALTNNGKISLKIPAYRHDINKQHDIAEELAISISYNNITPQPLNMEGKAYLRDAAAILSYAVAASIRQNFAIFGFNECVNYSFFKEQDFAKFNYKHKGSAAINVANPINPSLKTMRDSLVPGLIKNIALNKSFGEEDLKLFEIGTCFYDFNLQLQNAAFVLSGTKTLQSAFTKQANYQIADVKQYLASLVLNVFGIKEQSLGFELLVQEGGVAQDVFNPFNSYKITLGKTVIGIMGQVHPLYLQNNFEVKRLNVFFAELYLANLPEPKKSKAAYEERILQSVKRDLSFIAPLNLEAGLVVKTVLKNKNIEGVRITDVFKDSARLGEGNKSISISLNIKQGDTTLTKEQIDDVIIADVVALVEKLGCSLRDGLTE